MIEALVGVFLLAILSTGIYSSYAFGLKMSTQNRMRTEATAIAEKKIEAIKAMDYADIGVYGSIPPGPLPATENEVSNGTTYTIRTGIRYIDDPLDDRAPQDPAPTDYKQVEVKVDWPTNIEGEKIILNTLIAPPRVETNLGNGVLIINTVDSEGSPVTDCQVHIKNDEVNPPIDFTEDTDSDGSLTLPGIPAASSNSYEITLSKDGYETVQTYPSYPDSLFNPIDTHIAIAEGAITSKVFVVDKVSHQNLHFADIHGVNLPNLTFSLGGGRVIGTTVEAAPKPVYSYNENSLATNANGLWESPAVAKGPYAYSFSDPTYELITSSLFSPWSIAPDTATTIEMVLGDKTGNILVVSVKETGGETPIVGANVRITNSAGSLFQESVSDINGVAYFPLTENPPKTFLPEENYNIDVTKDGYLPGHEISAISSLTRKEVILSKQ